MKFRFYRQKQFDGGMMYAMPQQPQQVQMAYPQPQQPVMMVYPQQQPQKEEKMSTGKKIALGLGGLATAAGTAYAGYRGHLGAGIQKHLGTMAHKVGSGLGWNRLANSGATTTYAALGREAGAFSKAQARDVQRFGLDSLRNKEGNLSMKNLNKFDEEAMANRTNRQLGLSGDDVMSTNSVLINSGSRTSRGIGKDIDKNITTSTKYDIKDGQIYRYGDSGEKKILRDNDGNKYVYDSKKDVAKEYKEEGASSSSNNNGNSSSEKQVVTKTEPEIRTEQDIAADKDSIKNWIDSDKYGKMSKEQLKVLNRHRNDKGASESMRNYLTNDDNIGKFIIEKDANGNITRFEKVNPRTTKKKLREEQRKLALSRLSENGEIDANTGKLSQKGYQRLKNSGVITETDNQLHNDFNKTHSFEVKDGENGTKEYYLKKKEVEVPKEEKKPELKDDGGKVMSKDTSISIKPNEKFSMYNPTLDSNKTATVLANRSERLNGSMIDGKPNGKEITHMVSQPERNAKMEMKDSVSFMNELMGNEASKNEYIADLMKNGGKDGKPLTEEQAMKVISDFKEKAKKQGFGDQLTFSQRYRKPLFIDSNLVMEDRLFSGSEHYKGKHFYE